MKSIVKIVWQGSIWIRLWLPTILVGHKLLEHLQLQTLAVSSYLKHKKLGVLTCISGAQISCLEFVGFLVIWNERSSVQNSCPWNQLLGLIGSWCQISFRNVVYLPCTAWTFCCLQIVHAFTSAVRQQDRILCVLGDALGLHKLVHCCFLTKLLT